MPVNMEKEYEQFFDKVVDDKKAIQNLYRRGSSASRNNSFISPDMSMKEST